MKSQQRWAVCLLAALALSGCHKAPSGPPLPTLDARGLEQVVARHRGQVVLVVFWATWCPPCVELFPYVERLREQFGPRGLIVVTVSLDGTDEDAAVRTFLHRKGATGENFIARHGPSAKTATDFQIPNGAIPHLRLYDRQGLLVEIFPNGGRGLDHAEIAQAVERLVLESGDGKQP